MDEFIKDYNGEFIYINCIIYPMTAYFYKDRTILKKDEFYDLDKYITEISNKLSLGSLNVKVLAENLSKVLELVMNEKGIVKLSLKEKCYE